VARFRDTAGFWPTYAPHKLQALYSLPTPVDTSMEGRVELCIGKLGFGKTTWAALRAQRLARATGRGLATNGVDWPSIFRPVHSWEAMEDLQDCIFVQDEIHLMMPQAAGMVSAKDAKRYMDTSSLWRHRGVDVIGTAQSWTRPSTQFRHLVTTVWVLRVSKRGVLHYATPYDNPDDGGMQVFSRQWFGPEAAMIPSKAPVWHGQDPDKFAKTVEDWRRAATGANHWGAPEGAADTTLRPPTG